MSTVISSQPSTLDPVAPPGERDGLETALAAVWQVAQRQGAEALALYAVDDAQLYLRAVHGSMDLPPRITLPPDAPASLPRHRLYHHPPLPGAPHLPHSLWLPLADGSSLVGWLVVAAPPDAPLRRRPHWSRLRLAADGLAFALHAARLRVELEWRGAEVAFLQRVSRLVHSALSLPALLTIIVDELTKTWGYQYVTIYRLEGDRLVCAAYRGLPGQPAEPVIPVQQGIMGRAARTGCVQWAPDVQRDTDYVRLAPDVAGEIAVPIRVEDGVVAVLNVETSEHQALTERDVHFLDLLGEQIGVALQTTQVYEEAARRAEEVTALYTTVEAVNAELSLHEVLQTIVEQASRLIGAAGARIRLLTPDRRERVCVALTGDLAHNLLGHRVPATEGLTGRVLEEGAPVLINDVQEDPQLLSIGRERGVSALLSVPLTAKGGIIGELSISNGVGGRRFNERDLRLMTIFAQQASTALHHAQLYEAERRHVRQLGLANQVARLTTATLDIDAILTTAVRSLCQDLGYLGATILLYNHEREELELRSVSGPEELSAPIGTRYPVPGGLSGEAIVSGETVVSNDSRHDSRVRAATPVTPRSIVAAPLRSGSNILGVLSVASDTVNGFEPADVAVIQTIADQLGGALTAAGLYAETLAAKQRAETLLHEAQEVDRLKTEIVANFSHELRAPLASIKAYTELLLHYHQADGDLPRQFLTIVNEETDRLTDLVNEVLDLARLEAGRPEMEFSEVSLLSLVEEIVRVFDVQAQARAVQIEVEAAQPLPHFWGDRQLLGMLLRNLISNAVKYNRQGGSVHIILDQATEPNRQTYTRVRVQDTGVGIPADALPHLFEKFFRVRSTTESGIQGTGLGLTLAKAAVEAHRGKISVASIEGAGSEFTVLLPVTSPQASHSASQSVDGPTDLSR